LVKLPEKKSDPTLDAMNAAMEARTEYKRGYLGMSSIGNECERQLWLSFRWTYTPSFDAKTLKRFADGHASEAIMAARLKATPGVTLIDLDPETGRQFGYRDFGGHFRGHADGHIEGLYQAPKTPHIWEHKCSEKMTALQKLTAQNEKTALKQWNETYYAQAVLYMDYGGYSRHYLTCSTPGTRDETSCRTDADPVHAARLKAKAERIIFADEAPARISEDETFFKCRFCDFADVCRFKKAPERNCRTCAHVTPRRDGTWHCAKYDAVRTYKEQEAGCGSHLYNPTTVPGKPVDAGDNFVEYELENGDRWVDGTRKKEPNQ
jgi:hypothetical protein